MTDLAILIVNWNTRDLLFTCLSSVFSDLAAVELRSEVWIVDNASEDNSTEMVRAEFPRAQLIASHENLGFAGGNNLALLQMDRVTPPRYVFLLNPDTRVREGAIQRLVAWLDENSHVGVVGARLMYADGGFQHSAFHMPGIWQILFDLYPLPSHFHDSRLNGRYPRQWYQQDKPFAIDHPLGAAMMVRWQIIRQVGVFDHRFFMYCEEIDWCIRIKQAGWDIYCVPDAEIVHYEGQSTRQIREESFVNLWRSRRWLYDKHYSPLKRWLAKRLVRVGMRIGIRRTRQEEQHGNIQRTEAQARIRAYTSALQLFD